MREIYLDNAATTKINPRVLKTYNKISKKFYGNASSTHELGNKAFEEIEKARKHLAKTINAQPTEIIFTSGGTESNNLAIKGLAKSNPHKKHIITSRIEHPSVLEICKSLEKKGYKIDYLPVNKKGLISLTELKKKIKINTLLVSIMHVNNEIGTIQNLEEIGKICNKKKVYFHSDCVQSYNKIPLNVKKLNLDLISVSGHKINAPKGIGFLYVKKGTNISPINLGGGQEKGLRSGTLNTAGIISLAEATKIKKNKDKIKKSRDRILKEILKIPKTKLNGSKEKRIYNNINVSFYGIEGESIMLKLENKKIYISTGSACNSHKLSTSYVLRAIGVEDSYINGSIRITLCNALTKKEEDYVIKNIKKVVNKLREISPFK